MIKTKNIDSIFNFNKQLSKFKMKSFINAQILMPEKKYKTYYEKLDKFKHFKCLLTDI